MATGPRDRNFENSGQAHDADIDAIYGTEDAEVVTDQPAEETEPNEESETQ